MLLLRLLQEESNSFLALIRLHDFEYPSTGRLNLQRRLESLGLAIYYASLLRLESIVRKLLPSEYRSSTLPSPVNVQGGIHGNPFTAASAQGHQEIVRMLLDQGADMNAHRGDYPTCCMPGDYYSIILLTRARGFVDSHWESALETNLCSKVQEVQSPQARGLLSLVGGAGPHSLGNLVAT